MRYPHEIKVGEYVCPDGWKSGSILIASTWDKAAFRLPINDFGPITSLAVNVEVIGRSVCHFEQCDWLRVQITFVGDGEPDTVVRGFVSL